MQLAEYIFPFANLDGSLDWATVVLFGLLGICLVLMILVMIAQYQSTKRSQ